MRYSAYEVKKVIAEVLPVVKSFGNVSVLLVKPAILTAIRYLRVELARVPGVSEVPFPSLDDFPVNLTIPNTTPPPTTTPKTKKTNFTKIGFHIVVGPTVRTKSKIE